MRPGLGRALLTCESRIDEAHEVARAAIDRAKAASLVGDMAMAAGAVEAVARALEESRRATAEAKAALEISRQDIAELQHLTAEQSSKSRGQADV